MIISKTCQAKLEYRIVFYNFISEMWFLYLVLSKFITFNTIIVRGSVFKSLDVSFNYKIYYL